MRFDVTYENGDTVQVTPGPADVVAFEKEHKTTLGQAIRSGSPMWTYFITWHRLSRRGEGRTLEAWLDDVETIKSPEGEPDGKADPTSGAPDGAASAPADS